MKGPEDPLILALDIADRRKLEDLLDLVSGKVQTVKLGLEAYTRFGPSLFAEVKSRGFQVFADLKLHDIPNTVRGAVEALAGWEVDMISLHVAGGRRMLEHAVRAAAECSGRTGRAPRLLGVTVLTSLGEEDLEEVGWREGAEATVLRLARLGLECGLEGLVCSPKELPVLRKELGGSPILVTPGIRPAGEEGHDQIRTATPEEALRAGADYLVLGRAVTAHPRPLEVLQSIRASLGL